MYRGKLVNWNDDKGFGFISAAELSSNTFIHISTLKHMSRTPKQGDYIYFEVERHEGKMRATNARIEGVAAKKFKTSKSTNKPGANKLVPVLVVGVMSVLLFNYLDFTEEVSNPRLFNKSRPHSTPRHDKHSSVMGASTVANEIEKKLCFSFETVRIQKWTVITMAILARVTQGFKR